MTDAQSPDETDNYATKRLGDQFSSLPLFMVKVWVGVLLVVMSGAALTLMAQFVKETIIRDAIMPVQLCGLCHGIPWQLYPAAVLGVVIVVLLHYWPEVTR